MANIDDFSKLDIRVGRITNVEDVEKARKPIYKLTIDFGQEIGIRIILAGIKNFYSKEELMDRQIACLVNLDPKNIAGVESQGMILAADDENGLALMVPNKELANGSRVH
jgi:export-related chaperone CsaA